MSNKTNDKIIETFPAKTFSVSCRAFQIPYKISEVIDKIMEDTPSAEEKA